MVYPSQRWLGSNQSIVERFEQQRFASDWDRSYRCLRFVAQDYYGYAVTSDEIAGLRFFLLFLRWTRVNRVAVATLLGCPGTTKAPSSSLDERRRGVARLCVQHKPNACRLLVFLVVMLRFGMCRWSGSLRLRTRSFRRALPPRLAALRSTLHFWTRRLRCALHFWTRCLRCTLHLRPRCLRCALHIRSRCLRCALHLRTRRLARASGLTRPSKLCWPSTRTRRMRNFGASSLARLRRPTRAYRV